MSVTEPQMDRSDTLRLLKANLSSLRESVVLAVMRRNKLTDEVAKLEHLVADLETKALLSEKINNPMLAMELREDRKPREAELSRLRPLLQAAQLEAETAKLRLPEEEATLTKQIQDLENGIMPTLPSSIIIFAVPQSEPVMLNVSTEAESLFERAAEKTQALTQEALAREEVAPLHFSPSIAPLSALNSDASEPSVSSNGSFFDPPAMPIEMPRILENEVSTEMPVVLSVPTSEEVAPSVSASVVSASVSAMKTPEEMLIELEARLNQVQAQSSPTAKPQESNDALKNFLELDPPPSLQETKPEAELEVKAEDKEEIIENTVAKTSFTPPKREMYVPANMILISTTPGAPISNARKTEEKTEVPEPEMVQEMELESGNITEPSDFPDLESVTAGAAVAAALGVTPPISYSAKREGIEETSIEAKVEETMSVEVPLSEFVEAPDSVQSVTLSPEEAKSEAASTSTPTSSESTLSTSTEPKTVTQTQPSVRPYPKTERVRVAAVGTGGIWRGAHAPAYVDIAQMQLVAICDPDKNAQALAVKHYEGLILKKAAQLKEKGDHAGAALLEQDFAGLQVCDDISEVIENVKPDLVDLCTQPMLHASLSIQALEAGLNVMCEKPLSRSWLESKKLIETVQKTGKLYQHNENWLWDADYYTAKKLIDAGAIGEPIMMYLAQAHGGPEGNPNFWNPDFGGGGALLDNGIHAIGAAWFLCGLGKKPTLVKAAEPFGMSIRMPQRILDGRYQNISVEDDAHILIRFEDTENMAWTTAHVEGSWSHQDSPDTCIFGTTGKIEFKDENGHRYAVVLDAHNREARRIEVSGPTWSHWPSSHYGEILNMVECVRHNTPSICTAEFGADCSAIVGAAYLSEKNGRKAVHINEFKAFAEGIADRYPDDPKAADDALVEALLSAVRK